MGALLYLIPIYLIWGSTYLAMRIGVMPGSGFSPFIMAGSRLVIAGPILLIISSIRGNSVKINFKEFKRLFISGVLLWCTGHGLTLWSEQFVDSGYTALVISSLPVWVLIMQSIYERKVPGTIRTVLVLVGLGGIVFLVYPKLTGPVHSDFISTIVILISTISWGAGSLYQQYKPVKRSTITSSGYQQLFAGVVLLVVFFVSGGPMPHPTLSALMAWGYLTVFGSIIAFTVYVKALKELPAGIVMTHAYVNPIVAVTLGYMILSEPVTLVMALGGAAVLASVFVIIIRKR